MFHMINKLIGDKSKKLRFPIFLMIIDALGSMAMYFMLYLTVVDLLNDSFTKRKLLIYTVVCLGSVIYRIVIYQKSYLLCFTRAFDITHQMRIDLAEHFRGLSLGYFNQNSTGYLMNTLTNDIGSFEAILSHALSFLMKTAVLCIMILSGTFFINWKLALAECCVLLIAFPILLWSNRLIKKYGSQKRSLTEHMVSIVMEYIGGIKVFKSHNMTSTHFSRMLNTLEKVRRLNVHTECKLAVPVSMYSIVVNFLMPLVLLIGSYMLLGGGVMPEALIAFMIMSISLSALLIAFEHYYNMLKDLKLAASNLEKAFEYKPLSYIDNNVELTNFGVSFDHVNFSYESGNEVLHDVSFIAKEGTTTALIGPSGSGKSTVANLIARFWDASSGKICIGERNVKDLNPDRLLQYISEVFQDSFLLSDTILNNIKIGRPSAGFKEVVAAAKVAHCHEFIEKMPEGYDTVVTEGGASLSGGEKQRIAIARAVLKDAPILLLDESTASLDADNESKINRALDKLMEHKTVFVIAHRINTIRNADQIILLNKGCIEEIGNHNSLMQNQGHYYRMVQEQQRAKTWIVKGE